MPNVMRFSLSRLRISQPNTFQALFAFESFNYRPGFQSDIRTAFNA